MPHDIRHRPRSSSICLASVLSLAVVATVAGLFTEYKLGILADLSHRTTSTTQSFPEFSNLRQPSRTLVVPPAFRRKTPRYPGSGTLEDWMSWQEQLRDELLGEWFHLEDPRTPLDVRYEVLQSQEIRPGLRKISIALDSFDGIRLPVVVYQPLEPDPLPGVIVVAGHVRAGESALHQVAAEPDSYMRGAALAIAEAGFVTAAFELRGFGTLGPPDYPEHRIVAFNAILAGSFYKALIMRDIRRVVALLRQLPGTDAGNIGITGVSLGGELAATYAGLDPTIRATVFNAFSGRFGEFDGIQDPDASQPHYGHVIPGSMGQLRKEDIFLLIAPRPLLGVRGDDPPFIDRDFQALMQTRWGLENSGDKFALQIAEGGHEFFLEPTIEFLQTHLAELPPDPS
jgi:dienelactone hydrolase